MLQQWEMRQVYALIFCLFEWYGFDGKNQNVYAYLFNRGFPIEFLSKYSVMFATYLEGILTKEVWNDKDKLQKWLDKWSAELAKEIF